MKFSPLLSKDISAGVSWALGRFVTAFLLHVYHTITFITVMYMLVIVGQGESADWQNWRKQLKSHCGQPNAKVSLRFGNY